MPKLPNYKRKRVSLKLRRKMWITLSPISFILLLATCKGLKILVLKIRSCINSLLKKKSIFIKI